MSTTSTEPTSSTPSSGSTTATVDPNVQKSGGTSGGSDDGTKSDSSWELGEEMTE